MEMDRICEQRWVGTSEAAVYLGVSVWTIYRMAKERRIPSGRIGRRLRFRLADLDTALRRAGQFGKVARA
jgi:DNA binding domain, excisionase family